MTSKHLIRVWIKFIINGTSRHSSCDIRDVVIDERQQEL